MIYKYCLIILLLATLFITCGKKTVDHAQKAHYLYLNATDMPVVMILENRNPGPIHYEYIINPGDSIGFAEEDLGVVGPFVREMADSIVFKFSDEKCVSYVLGGGGLPNIGDGVFNLENYRDFVPGMLSQQSYRITYKIDEDDYNKATPCP